MRQLALYFIQVNAWPFYDKMQNKQMGRVGKLSSSAFLRIVTLAYSACAVEKLDCPAYREFVHIQVLSNRTVAASQGFTLLYHPPT